MPIDSEGQSNYSNSLKNLKAMFIDAGILVPLLRCFNHVLKAVKTKNHTENMDFLNGPD